MKANFIIRAALQSDAVELKNLFQNTNGRNSFDVRGKSKI